MKKNTLQKAVATALVGAMAVSTLAGCNNSSDTNSTTATSKQDETTTQAPSTEGNTQETTTQAASSSDSTGTAGIDGWEPLHLRFLYTTEDHQETAAQMLRTTTGHSGYRRTLVISTTSM